MPINHAPNVNSDSYFERDNLSFRLSHMPMPNRCKHAVLKLSKRCIPFSDVSRELLSRSHRPRTTVNLQGSVASWIRSAFTGVRIVRMPPAAGGVGKTRRSSLRSGPSLDEVAQTYFGPMSGRIQPVTVITRAADASEPAHSIDVEVAMRQASRHLSMTLKIPFRQERCSNADLLRSTARLREKSRSSRCCPTFCCSSLIRRPVLVSAFS